MTKQRLIGIALLIALSVSIAGCTETTLSTTPSNAPTATTTVAPSNAPTQTNQPPLAEKLARVTLYNATLLEGDWATKELQNIDYIKSLVTDKLLYHYWLQGGVEIKSNLRPYGDWESNYPHLGITMGHYITACSMLYIQTGDQWFIDKVNYCVDELEKCQQPNGYLLAQPIQYFDYLEAGAGLEKSGVPYYFVHKIIAGLLDAHKYCGNEKALNMASRVGDWVYSRMSGLNAQQLANTMTIEYGGIAESLYDLYALTKKENHLAAARMFHEAKFLNAWANNLDNLAGVHANTTIPKATAFVKEYLLSGNAKYLTAAQNFWQMVVSNHTYANGGNSYREVFMPAGQIYDYCNEYNDNPAETCNSYNMIKLSQYLYEITGEMKYMDYIEQALLNSIMGSINTNGCKTYYQFMYPNATKLFHSRKGGFWCCTGTGMENFAKVVESIYHNQGDTVYYNVFISSTYTDGTFKADMNCEEGGKNVITVTAGGTKTIALRVPYWTADPTLKINGESVMVKTDANGYMVLNRTWKAGDKIEYTTPYTGRTIKAADRPYMFSVMYGPYLLASGELASLELKGSYTDGWLANLTDVITNNGDGTYVLDTGAQKLTMQKYGTVTTEKFNVYFKRVD